MYKNVLLLFKNTFVNQRIINTKWCLRSLSTNNKSSDGYKELKEEGLLKKHINPFAIKTTSSAFKDSDNVCNPPVGQKSLEEQDRRLKVLQLEVDIVSQEGRKVPQLDFFKEHHWKHVLTLPSKSARMKYYNYLWLVEMKKQAKIRKKQERAAEAQQRIESIREERANNKHIVYGLGHVSMFLRVYDTTINNWMNNRLVRAMQFSPKIVLDCSYDKYMTKREAENAAKQLMLCFAENRMHDDPFDLHYCNVELETPCMQSLQRYIPTMLNPEFPMNVHHKCFTEIFPKENIVYLTPHCNNDLPKYNPDDVYVVGAMVDTVNNEPLSLAKAKRLGLRMARLPLDRYLQWGSGSGKSLTLNQMINILLDLKKTGDWMTALRHVPRRKIVDQKTQAEKHRMALSNRANKCSVRIDRIMSDDLNSSSVKQQVRSHRENLEFNISTWGSNKKERQIS